MADSSILEIFFRIRNIGTGAKDAQSDLASIQAQAVSLQGAVGALAGGVGLGLLISGLKSSVEAAMESQQVMAATENVIKSTGGAAGLSADQIHTMAGKLSQMSGVQDETIQSGSNLLLTFKEIKGQTFDRATADMLDMAVAMNQGSLEGIDLKSTAIQVGKALNVTAGDVQGATTALSALHRVGVSFTDEQKKAAEAAVKLGDVEKFQGIILSELESEFGGAAKAAGDTAAGSFDKLKNSVKNLSEEVGGYLLPMLTQAADAANILITWDEHTNTALTEQQARVIATADGYDNYVAKMTAAADAAGKNVITTEEYNRRLTEVDGGLADANTRIVLLTESEFNAARTNDAWTDAVTRGSAATKLLTESLNASLPTIDVELTKTNNMAAATRDATTALENLQTKQAGWAQGTAQGVIAALGQAGVKGQDYANALLAIDGALGTTTAADAAKQQALDDLTKKYAAGKLSVEDYQTGLSLLYTKEMPESKKAFEDSSTATKRLGDEVDALKTKTGTNLPPAIGKSDEAIALFGASMKKQYAPSGELPTYVIGLSILTGQALAAAAAIRSIPPLPMAPNVGGGGQPGPGGYVPPKTGYAAGGISTGSESGHWEVLHGTEAVIPLEGNNYVPVEVRMPTDMAYERRGRAPDNLGGNNVNITIVYHESPLSMSDRVRFETEVIPTLKQALDRA